MESLQRVELSHALTYLSAKTPEAVALVQVKKAWCSPIQELGAYSGDTDGFRLRISTRAWIVGGPAGMVKLWFYMSSHEAALGWLERLREYSCWSVEGRLVDVGHPKYQTIAVSDMQPMSAATMRIFLPLVAQISVAV